MKQMIAFHPGEGISNRVIKLILCIRHTADKSKPVLLNWDTTANSVVKEPFSKLFKFEYDCDLVETDIPINISEIWGTDYINCADTCIGGGGGYKNLGRYFGANVLDIVEGHVVEWNSQSKNNIHKGFIYEAPQELLNNFLPLFKALKPSTYVEKRISQVKTTNYVSVHIRLDNVWKEWGRGTDKDINDFFSVMDNYPKDTLFFLASADPRVAAKFVKRYGKRIIQIPDKDFSSDFDAVADIYLLSRGRELIASYGSSFSNLSWWLSGCKMKVTVVGDSQNWQHNGVPKPKKPLLLKRIINALIRRLRKFKSCFQWNTPTNI